VKLHAPVRDALASHEERTQPTSAIAPASASYPPTMVFDAALIATAEAALAQHIGPVARAVVRRATATARSEPELWNLLANQIDDVNDRKAFLRKVL
jgi:eukaryotic-like serine/threonine-protein kinase